MTNTRKPIEFYSLIFYSGSFWWLVPVEYDIALVLPGWPTTLLAAEIIFLESVQGSNSIQLMNFEFLVSSPP